MTYVYTSFCTKGLSLYQDADLVQRHIPGWTFVLRTPPGPLPGTTDPFHLDNTSVSIFFIKFMIWVRPMRSLKFCAKLYQEVWLFSSRLFKSYGWIYTKLYLKDFLFVELDFSYAEFSTVFIPLKCPITPPPHFSRLAQTGWPKKGCSSLCAATHW